MTQLISEHTTECTSFGLNYRVLELQNGRHAARVAVVTGRRHYINVLVLNASAKAHKLMFGRDFETVEDAIAHYKTPQIKDMIRFAAN